MIQVGDFLSIYTVELYCMHVQVVSLHCVQQYDFYLRQYFAEIDTLLFKRTRLGFYVEIRAKTAFFVSPSLMKRSGYSDINIDPSPHLRRQFSI